jgi:hypothetical protein
MKVARLDIENFRGIRKATLDLEGHTLWPSPSFPDTESRWMMNSEVSHGKAGEGQ